MTIHTFLCSIYKQNVETISPSEKFKIQSLSSLVEYMPSMCEVLAVKHQNKTKTFLKIGIRLHKKGYKTMTKKKIKECSTSWIIRKIKRKTIIRYQYSMIQGTEQELPFRKAWNLVENSTVTISNFLITLNLYFARKFNETMGVKHEHNKMHLCMCRQCLAALFLTALSYTVSTTHLICSPFDSHWCSLHYGYTAIWCSYFVSTHLQLRRVQ